MDEINGLLQNLAKMESDVLQKVTEQIEELENSVKEAQERLSSLYDIRERIVAKNTVDTRRVKTAAQGKPHPFPKAPKKSAPKLKKEKSVNHKPMTPAERREFASTIGKKLREERKNQNLTVDQMAEKTKIGKSSIYRIEAGQISDLAVVAKYARSSNLGDVATTLTNL